MNNLLIRGARLARIKAPRHAQADVVDRQRCRVVRAEVVARREHPAGKQIEIEPRKQEILPSDAAGDAVLIDAGQNGCLIELDVVGATPGMPSKLVPTLWFVGLLLQEYPSRYFILPRVSCVPTATAH